MRQLPLGSTFTGQSHGTVQMRQHDFHVRDVRQIVAHRFMRQRRMNRNVVVSAIVVEYPLMCSAFFQTTCHGTPATTLFLSITIG